ncbi:MAG: hypothetical protein J0M12_05505 [Deltaproteobacteria bacterium]|nr:hypothetical protein [Deltaproteobacteria bacterium]
MQVAHACRSLSAIFFANAILTGCTEPSNSTDTSQPSEASEISISTATGPTLSSACGIITNGEMHSNLSSSVAQRVSVYPLNTDLVVVTSLEGIQVGGSTLVQLQGLTSQGINEYQRQKGLELIYELSAQNAYFVTGGAACSLVVDGGGNGVVGQIFSSTGQSINESLLSAGVAKPRGADGCGGDILQSCYEAVPVPEEFSPLVINNFLWKPVSDNDGRLVIGVDEFVTVKVSGAITESHPAERYAGAPYVTFIRYGRPGCSYGNNVRIDFYDQNGLRLKTGNGQDHITVASGCTRNEQRF